MKSNKNEKGNGTDAVPLVIEYSKMTPQGEALDIGAGQGDNAIYLAEHGFSVTAVEINEKQAEIIRNKAKEKRVDIKIENLDLKVYPIERSHYSFITAIYVMHFLAKDYFEKTVSKIKNGLKKGGVAVISLITDDDPLAQELRKIAEKENSEILIDKKEMSDTFSLEGNYENYLKRIWKSFFISRLTLKIKDILDRRSLTCIKSQGLLQEKNKRS